MLYYCKTELADLPVMIDLCERFLNSGEFIERFLREGVEMPGFVGVKCMDGDTMVGVFSARPGVWFTYDHPEFARLIEEGWGHERIYTGEILTVLPAYRGMGVARELTRAFRDGLLEQDAKYLVVELWRKFSDGDEPASKLMKYIGTFEETWESPDFYKDLDKYGMTCPDCGQGPCRCGATVGVIKL